MNYSLVIFDIAPTGHTLKMLNFPKALKEVFGKLNALKFKIGPMSGLLASTLGEGFKIKLR